MVDKLTKKTGDRTRRRESEVRKRREGAEKEVQTSEHVKKHEYDTTHATCWERECCTQNLEHVPEREKEKRESI